MMKQVLIAGLSAAMLLAASNASAVVCARGVVRAGCAGPNGAVVAHRPVAVAPVAVVHRPVAVVHPAHCRYVNGRRVC
jgi:hypothetical protein